MGRMVTKPILALSVTADATQDVWSVLSVSPNRVKLHGFELTSNAVSSVIIALVLRRITAVGTGGAAASPATGELDDDILSSAATATWRELDTTEGTGGGDIMGFQWEQQGPVGHVWTPETRPTATLTDGFALSWRTATSATVSGWIQYEEL